MIDIRKIKHGYWWNAQNKFLSLVNKENVLKEITIQVTDRCNMACIKCHRVNMTSADMDAKTVLRIIGESLKLGLKHIHFTGGEPTMHPQFLDIVAFCRKNDLRVDMSTNGKFDKNYAKELGKAGIDSINMSWDFIENPPQCLKFAKYTKANLFLNHMVMPSNFPDLWTFLLFIRNTKEYNSIIDIQLMPPRGDAEKFTKEQISYFKKEILPYSMRLAKGRFPMVEAKLKELLPTGAEKGIYHRDIKWPCHRSKSELRVGCKGFTTCTYLYRDGMVTCSLDTDVKSAWGKCKEMCRKAPPSKMCELSCSPEVANFNSFVDEELNKKYQGVA